MELTQKPTVNCISERWKMQYTDKAGGWKTSYMISASQTKRVYNQLVALAAVDNKAITQANAIIGNASWGGVICHNCGKYRVAPHIIFDSRDGYACIVCLKCIKTAKRKLAKAIRKNP